MSVDKKLSKLDEKTRRKISGSIYKKSPKSDKKTKRETDHLVLCIFVYEEGKTSET